MTVSTFSPDYVHVIGGGLAGSESAWQLAKADTPVMIHEMRPHRQTDVHQTGDCAELVCSNSFRSDDASANAIGVLHEEMRLADSLIMRAADQNRLPAGSALAVDRIGFSQTITKALEDNPLITINREEVMHLPVGQEVTELQIIVATGPLTSPALSNTLRTLTGSEQLAFFDAIAPVVYQDSLNMNVCWMQSRYDKSTIDGDGADYINCPLSQQDYTQFINSLIESDTMPFHDWERDTPYFEGCLPIEVMAVRGPETLRHGPMKPVGLTNQHKPDEHPYAVMQLRQDNAAA
ncbi:MAG: methylenetetrahydrofolate--tRNA-(uracil(54)-C(5))-methyltransferase (FADH(2)-oxidizing) TrmFO, partial [Parvularculales bacterium]